MYDAILTVVTAAPTQDLTRLETVKEELGYTDGQHDAELRRRIAEKSALVARYCNRVFASETVEETFTLARSLPVLSLARYPVSEVAAVTENDAALTAEDFQVSGHSGLLYRLAGGTRCHWPAGVTVVRYTGGYPLLTGLPPDLEEACRQLVVQAHLTKGRDLLVRSENVPGVGSVGFDTSGQATVGGMPKEIAERLDVYRKLLV